MNLLSDIITYVRRIIKSPSDATITDNLIIDYINRFWLMDVDARLQLFDLKSTYQFQTTPGITKYNMPLYNIQIQPGNQPIASFPVYQGFLDPCFVNGIQVPFYTQRQNFYNIWPTYTQPLQPAATGDGTAGPYTINLPFFPAIPGHVDITGIIATGSNNDPPVTSTFLTEIPTTSVFSSVYFTATAADGSNIVVADSGQFLQGAQNYGLLMEPGQAPVGNSGLSGGYSTTSNTVNYATGVANITFPSAIPSGNPINSSCIFIEPGVPRAILYYNNTLEIAPPPSTQYLVSLEAYLSPAAFFDTANAIPFAYMAEYIARGAARKILSDTGDTEQFMFYEPLFREQEMLVWKRSQRQFTATRTETIFSQSMGQNAFNQSSGGT